MRVPFQKRAAFGATLGAAALSLAALAVPAARAGEARLPVYETVPGVAGDISAIGSDTLNNLMAFWSEAFRVRYPNVNVQIEGKGSGTAPPALAAGVAQLGPMSREMTPAEIEAFEAKRGFKPLAVAVAVDCLAVYVHKDNPVRGLSLAEVDAVFSSTRKRGRDDPRTWGGLGHPELAGEWANRPFSLYGRNAASGTYAFFKEHVLKKGDFKDSVKEQPGSSAVVGGIAGDKSGIGYSGIGYKTSDVRAVPLAEKEGGEYVEADFDRALDGSYPLARLLYVYVPKKPGAPLDAASLEFLKFILSEEGQEIVRKDGYGALPADLAADHRARLEE